ncbi:MAG: hypothetical protein AAB573_01030 [Patescibacteria group bacterium]
MAQYKKFERPARLNNDQKVALNFIEARAKGRRGPKLSRVQQELVRVAHHDPKPVSYEVSSLNNARHPSDRLGDAGIKLIHAEPTFGSRMTQSARASYAEYQRTGGERYGRFW